jgi:succinate dehydrogenase / fumarate reductase, membrane anchor subunit
MSLRSPLGTVLGRGTGGNAVHHWWVQRLTALALLPLTVWLLAGLVRLPLTDFATVTAWISLGWNPVLMSLLVGVLCWHSSLGVQVVLEDYVHTPALQTLLLVLSKFAHVLLAATGVYAVLHIALRS